MKKIILFFELFASIIAIIGGIGYTCMCKSYVITIAIVILSIIAFPQIKKIFKELAG